MAKKKKVKIGRVQSKRSKNAQPRGKSKLTPFKIILIASFLTLIIGITFAVIQFLGEMFGVIPTIQLGSLNWGFSGDPIIIFIIGFLSSIFTGTLLVLFLIRNQLIK